MTSEQVDAKWAPHFFCFIPLRARGKNKSMPFAVQDVIEIPVSDACIEKTMRNVVRKIVYTRRNNIYQRELKQQFEELFRGDLAKNAIIEYLTCQGVNGIIDYDEIRDDDFQNPDRWDFKVGNRTVEVRSSIPTNMEDRGTVIRNRDIKIICQGDMDNDIRDIHIQIYYYPHNEQVWQEDEDPFELEEIDWEEIKEMFNPEAWGSPLFFGWNNKESIVDYLSMIPIRNRKWTFFRARTDYWKCPIREARTMDELVDFLKE